MNAEEEWSTLHQQSNEFDLSTRITQILMKVSVVLR